MAPSAPGILVIDDDEVVLVAVADLLEAADFRVSCLSSPAGAADIAAGDPSLVAVVLDLNMPIMRGDNVARVFLSRASLRDLPLILVSGDTPALAAVRKKMPNVKVVAKVDMERQLVAVVRDAIREQAQRRTQRGWGSEPSENGVELAGTGAEASFFRQLANEMKLARELWHDPRTQSFARLAAALRALYGEADRRALFQAGQLLRALEQIVVCLQQGATLPPSAQSQVLKAIDQLAAMGRDKSALSMSIADSLVESLRRLTAELRTKRHES